jgi:putative inorganic carbon (HCO3(-)) transporter
MNSFVQGKEILFKIIILVSIFIFSIIIDKTKINKFYTNPLFIILLLGFFFLTIANLFSETPIVSIYGSFTRGFGFIIQLYIAVFGLFCMSILNKESIKKLIKVVFICGILIGIYAIFQKLGVDPLFKIYNTDLFEGRVFSTLGNPGYLGQFITLVLFIGGYLFISSKSKLLKLFYGIAEILLLGVLLLTETRAALIALFICFLLLLVRYRILIWKQIKRINLAIVITLIVLVVFLSSLLFFSVDINRLTSFRSLNSRFEIWQGTIELISERPVIGYGEETFYIHAPEIINKTFLTLEENLNISIDRIHNEFLHVTYSYGIFQGILYLIFFGFLIYNFFKTKDQLVILLTLLVIANMIQNQFTFSDISITLLITFAISSIIAIQSTKKINYELKYYFKIPLFILVLLCSMTMFLNTIYYPYMANAFYYKSHENYKTSYATAVESHKIATLFTPYYSDLWYELMFLDKSSSERALHYLEQIEGESGNVLAWKGNYYSESDPALASKYFYKALLKNPYYPNWIRAYADMLYINGDYAGALYLYSQYLEYVPEFWQWADVNTRSPEEKKSYRIFFKQVPDFWQTVDRVNELTEIVLPETN